MPFCGGGQPGELRESAAGADAENREGGASTAGDVEVVERRVVVDDVHARSGRSISEHLSVVYDVENDCLALAAAGEEGGKAQDIGQ